MVAAALLFLRKPDVLLHAELWGDDGWSWYPDAYRIGARSLLLPVNGYLNTAQRLVAIAVQPLPLAWAPTIFAAAGLLAQIAPALFLVSARMASAWPSRRARLLFAVIFLLLPNVIELYGNLTNAQWNFALLAFLILVSDRPATRAGWVFDGAALVLSGLSGPFCLLLAPIAAWQVAAVRRRVDVGRAVLLGAAACVQLYYLAGAPHAGRLLAPLGAGMVVLARIVAVQVVMGAELGYATIRTVPQAAFWRGPVAPVVIVLVAAVLAAYAQWRGPRTLRQFTLFAALVLAGALASPQVSVTVPQWQAMAIPPMGNRYFCFAMIAWVGTLFMLVADRAWAPRITGAVLLAVVMAWGIPADFREMRFSRTDFVRRARAFAVAPPGTRGEFPIIPPGLSPMVLVKR